MTSISEAIDWWENKLTAEQRSEYLKIMYPTEKTWSGPTEERHAKLLNIYELKKEAEA